LVKAKFDTFCFRHVSSNLQDNVANHSQVVDPESSFLNFVFLVLIFVTSVCCRLAKKKPQNTQKPKNSPNKYGSEKFY